PFSGVGVGIPLVSEVLEARQKQEMYHRLWGSALFRDAALMALIGLYLTGILFSHLTIWPERSPTILLALPLVAVSLTKPPQFVIGTALLAMTIHGVDIYIAHPPLTSWGISFAALVGIGFLTTLVAVRREQAAEKTRRQEERIRAVEQLRQPLTVVVGYTQILRARPDLPLSAVVPLERIDTAAKRLQQQVDGLLDGSTHSSTQPLA
ncbi:MAG TPA: histidine kinase dimerization/phospho-acceptor domain-containing protein, partial [Chloroflexota bacterium]|nr:histidine kinase dimerization/phospho-acceptor domain-containing protein [Chloroflexota bacterium]